MKRPTVAQNVALSVTVLAAILLMLLLLGVRIEPARHQPTEPENKLAMADPDMEDEPLEEMFIEPELAEAGDPDNLNEEQDALTPQGEPDPAEVPNDKLVANGSNPNPNPEANPKVSSKTPSQVKTTDSSQKTKPDQRIQDDNVQVKGFNNGKKSGKGDTASSGKGDSSNGSARGVIGGGRKLENNPTIKGFTVSKQITVTVTVMVKADGRVVPGSFKCNTTLKAGSGNLLQKLKQSSEATLWTKKPGAPNVQATITWILKPGTR